MITPLILNANELLNWRFYYCI